MTVMFPAPLRTDEWIRIRLTRLARIRRLAGRRSEGRTTLPSAAAGVRTVTELLKVNPVEPAPRRRGVGLNAAVPAGSFLNFV